MDNDKPGSLPCDGCKHLICALERSIVCGGREAAATIMKREDAAACDRREGKEPPVDSLRPCPFCSSGWLYETRRNGYCDETPTIFCNSCKAVVTWEQVEEEGVNDETKAFVREHWNTRAERTCRVEMNGENDAAVCSQCGSSMLIRDIAELKNWDGDVEIMKFITYPYCPNCGAKVIGG